jgi:signal transduction histidine kinase
MGTISTVVMESLRTVADDKHISLSLNAPKQLPMVMGDRDKLEQILWNLIGNALKFTPPGGSVTTELEATPDGMVQICVADTGCGIPQEYLHKIFDEFSKVPSSVPGSQGAQLGLFITKSFVTMHKGKIWVESTEGVGTKFYFTLPCAPNGLQSTVPPQGDVEPPDRAGSGT